MINLLTNKVTKKTVGPESKDCPEDVPDVPKPFDDSIMSEIPDSVKPNEEFKKEVKKEWLKTFSLHHISIFPSCL